MGSLGIVSITGLNHLTMAVSDLDRSVAFYTELLGFSLRMRAPSSAYLEAGQTASRAEQPSALPEKSSCLLD